VTASIISADSSLLIPALAPAHPQHAQCRPYLGQIQVLVAHTVLETYSRLTTVREGITLRADLVAEVLRSLRLPTVQLPAEEYVSLVGVLASAGRAGGAIYDAQIAATAKHHGLKLLSRDHRAAATYALIGAEVELI